MTEQEFRERLQELRELLNKMIDGALVTGDLWSPEVQRVLLQMLQEEVGRLLQEVNDGDDN